MITRRPTRAEHEEQCRLFSVALTDYVRELHELCRFPVDNWEPAPMPADWDGR